MVYISNIISLQGWLMAKYFAFALRLSNYIKDPLFWLKPAAYSMYYYTNTVPFVVDRVRFPFLQYLSYSSKIHITTFYKKKHCNCIKITHPFQEKNDHAIFYIHGGGFVSGDIQAFQGFTQHIAEELKCDVFLPDYNLIPETSLDHIITDCTFWLYYLSSTKKKWTIMADSAGAYIALAMLQNWRYNMIKLDGLVLISPISALKLEQHSEKPVDPTIPVKWLHDIFNIVDKGHTIRFDMSENKTLCLMPKQIYISVSRDEYLFYHTLNLMKWTLKNRCNIMMNDVCKMPHSFLLYYQYLYAGKENITKMIEWIRSYAT